MKNFSTKLKHIFSSLLHILLDKSNTLIYLQLGYFITLFSEKLKHIFSSLLHILLYKSNTFCIQLSYFITLSLLGFLALKSSKTRTFTPPDFDLFFTSVSATTVSSMSAVEMEVFSNTQLVFLTILMFVGGEVFTSILELHLMWPKINEKSNFVVNPIKSSDSNHDHIEVKVVTPFQLQKQEESNEDERRLKLKSIKALAYLVSCYTFLVHAIGSILIYIYLTLISSARKVLERKNISLQTFSTFTAVSTFANCGFVPTKENMMVFKKNSGLLLILIPQILMGNTLYPVCLRLLIRFMEKLTGRREFGYMLKNSRELGYEHLFSGLRCVYLGITALGFIVLQLVIYCLLEWNNSEDGLSVYEKMVGILFQVVNSRHAGENVFDLSAFSPAILVLFIFMMYLPPYTSYLPTEEADDTSTRKNEGFGEKILFSQLSYLVIFIILICITEREKMKNDPLNFNVLNIVVEVISAYGNVGFTVGYSCERQINPDSHCKNAWYGFVGRWSNAGKFVLIVVMFFGRLKKFSNSGGRAWTLV